MTCEKKEVVRDKYRLHLVRYDNRYDCRENSKGNGLVVILIKDAKNEKYLIRKENCPPHNSELGYCYTAVTGMIDGGETPFGAMCREMLEETGITIGQDTPVKYLYGGFTNKNSSNYIHVYEVITDMDICTGDGTYGEECATSLRCNDDTILNSIDYLPRKSWYILNKF